MKIQINTDRNIEGREEVAAHVQSLLEDALERFRERITRLEVHLSDENSRKKGPPDDKRCMIEARLSGLQPTSVTHSAATLDQAVKGAAEKMKRSIESTLGRQKKKSQ